MNKQAKTTKPMNDSKRFPLVQVTYLEQVGDAVSVYPYGSHGSAPIGSRCLLVTILGDEGNRYVIPLSTVPRPTPLKENEFVCGNFVVGSTMLFDADGNITVTCKKDMTVNVAGKMDITVVGNTTLTTPNFIINGNIAHGTNPGGGSPEVSGTWSLRADSVMNAKGTINNSGLVNNTNEISGFGDVKSGTIVLDSHIHSGVDAGPDNTGAPVP